MGPKSTSLVLAGASLLVTSVAPARPEAMGPATAAQRAESWAAHQRLESASPFHGLEWRSIGPVGQGGRVVDVEPIPGEPDGFYVAYATGGIWKTVNGGGSFEPLTDALPTMVMGDLAVDPSNPQRLWVGTGEPNSSRSSYGGLGVFRSDDGGRSFRAMGLEDSDRIGRIVVDPKDGDHVCVAMLGKLYSTGGSRGVTCTFDGGESWSHTLKGETAWTGAIDLVMQPGDAQVLYAATWERSRTPWNLEEAGAGSAIHRSSDGGRTWTKLAGGLPQGEKVGRIGLAVTPAAPRTVYAVVDLWEPLPKDLVDLGERPLSLKRLRGMDKAEFLRQDPEEIESFIRDNDLDTTLDAKALIEKVRKDEVKVNDLVRILESANDGFAEQDIWGHTVWRSDDAGATWRRTHAEPLREVSYTYGYYFGLIAVAPDDAERVYTAGVPMIASEDGGATWRTLQVPSVHVDYHSWWIDPRNPKRMIVGNDGGLDLTLDGGKTWRGLDAQPVGQFYTIAVDLAEPYNVYGGLQDNGTWKGSSKTRWELGEDWRQIGGGDGMHVAVDPRDAETVYTGYQFGVYQRSGPKGRQEVRPRASLNESKLRYNWNTPVVLSPHDPDTVYFGTYRVMRSTDQGESWTAISPDLTTAKERGDVPYATITSIAESPKQLGLIWAGTDDGHVWLTRSAGDAWSAVDAGLPAARWVSRVVASAHARERAYVALNGYRNDDPAPYVYVTEDFGRRWRSIASNLPHEPVNVVREDPVNPQVLYVGTDRGVYVSLDRGERWHALQAGLPNVPVHDLVVHPRERELVAGTHGRSAFVVDVLPIQELDAAARAQPLKLFPVSAVQASREWRSRPARWFDESPHLPFVDVPYWSKDGGEATLRVLDGQRRPLREIDLKAKAGVNRVRYDLAVDEALALAAERAALGDTDAKAEGALAKQPYAESLRLGHRLLLAPGKYTLELVQGNATQTTELEIKAPEARKPRAKAPMKIRGR